MNLSAEQLAELIAGVARAQNAIIDAVDRANAGWRNTHLIPMLNVAANMRTAEPRLLDLPSRVLLRLQGRPTLDYNAIKADLVRLIGPDTGAPAQVPAAAPPAAAAAPRPAAASSAAASPAPASTQTPAAPVNEEELFDFLKKS